MDKIILFGKAFLKFCILVFNLAKFGKNTKIKNAAMGWIVIWIAITIFWPSKSSTPVKPTTTQPTQTLPQLPPKGGMIVFNDYLDGKGGKYYKGMPLSFTGTVHTADWGPDKSEGLCVILEFANKKYVLTSWFAPKEEKKILALVKGQTITIHGNLDSGFRDKQGAVFVQLEDCNLD